MMLTRCPNCATAFRVSLDQITARHGKVRCGHCTTIFNALDTLVDVATGAQSRTQAHDRQPLEHAARRGTRLGAEPNRSAGHRTADIDIGIEPLPDAGATGSAEEPDRLLAELGELEPAEDVFADREQMEVQEPSDEVVPEVPKKRRAATWFWAFAALIMLVASLAHAAYLFRGELAARYPDLRPPLASLCATLECEIPLPRTSDLVSIETSDLHPDNQQKNRMTLTATIKNRAGYVQAYPHIELTLTDTKDRALASRVLEPGEYLRPGTNIAAGFGAQSEVAIGAASKSANSSRQGTGPTSSTRERRHP